MGIGASVLLIAIGAILTFALNVQVGFLDLDIVGWILMIAGVVGLIFTTLIWGPRSRRSVTRDTVDPVDPTMPTTPTSTTYRRRQVEEHTDV
ncbi:MAG TPA: DUF6458 family protein [Candidatus Limnocylindrales bacterium]